MKLPPHRIRPNAEPSGSDRQSGIEATPSSPPPLTLPNLPAASALAGADIGRRRAPSGSLLGRLAKLRKPVCAAVAGALLATAVPAMAQTPAQPVMSAETIAAQLGQVRALGAPLEAVASGYADQLQADALAQLRPQALFDQMEAGKLVVQVPLRAGTYEVGGTKITVQPGTVVYATAEIQDGRLVPYRHGDGTRVQLTKAIDGPVWTTANGVYLQDKGGGRGQAMVDVVGWFDKALADPGDLKVSGIIDRLTQNIDAAGTDTKLPEGLVDWDGLRFQLDPVRMGDGVVDLGGVKLDLADGTQLRVSGTLDQAQLTAHFALDGAQIRQPGLRLDLGESSADLRITSRTDAQGNLHVRGGLTNITGNVSRFMAGYDKDGTSATLDLRAVRLDGASLDMSADLAGVKAGAPRLAGHDFHFVGQIDGRIANSQVSLPDGRGTADLSFSAGRVKGSVDVSGDRVALHSKLTDAHLSLRDLQPKDGATRFDVRSGDFEGDVELRFDTKTGAYGAVIDADRLGLVIADLATEAGPVVDLGRTELSGSGRVELGPQTLRVEGDIAVSGRIDDLKVQTGQDGNKSVFDVAAGSTMQGKLRSLVVQPDAPLQLDAEARVALDLEGYAVEIPGLTAHGPTRLAGEARLQVKDDAISLSKSNLVATMTLEDGTLAAGEGALALDLAKGSNLRLAIREAGFGATEGPTLKLGAGSFLEARLDGGHLDIAQRRVEFEPGTLVRFELANLERTANGPELVGSLFVDAPVRLNPLVPVSQLEGLVGEGGAGLRIDGVRFGADGKLSLEGVNLSFEGSVGSVERVSPAQGTARLSTLLAAHPELGTQQDLINYFYRVGGDWDGASRAASVYGLDLSVLVQDRGAEVQVLAARDGATAAQLLAVPHEVPTAKAVSEMHAGRTLGVPEASAPIELTELAKRVQDGRLIFSVPLSGEMKGVAFEPGTKLYVVAQAENGQVVPGKFDAFLSKPGDAFLWTTLDGAYLDENNSLMLDVGWWWDQPVEGFENLPMDIPSLVDRLMNVGGGEDAGGDFGKVVDISKAEIALVDLTLKEGKLPFGLGHLELAEGTKLSVAGSLDNLSIRGHVKANHFVVDSDVFAIDARSATADLHVRQVATEDDGRTATATFSNLQLDGQGVMFRDDTGNLVHLGKGQANGEVVLTAHLDADGKTTVGTHFTLDAFDGEVEAIRVKLASGDDAPWITIGPSHYNGRFSLDSDGQVSLHGHASSLDARLDGATIAGPAGPISLDEARLFGSGVLSMDGGKVAFLGGKLSGAATAHAEDLDIADVFPGYLEQIEVDGAKATFRFDLDHVDRVEHDPSGPLIIDGAKGRLGGAVSFDALGARISAKPFDSGLPPASGPR